VSPRVSARIYLLPPEDFIVHQPFRADILPTHHRGGRVGLRKGFWMSEEMIWLRVKAGGAWEGVLGGEGGHLT
jgi:hypothetical protein